MMMHLQRRTGFNDNDDNEDDADDEDDDEADADAEDEDDEDDAPAKKRPGCVQLDEVDVGPTLAVHFLHNYLQLSFFLLILALSLIILFCANHLCKTQFFF